MSDKLLKIGMMATVRLFGLSKKQRQRELSKRLTPGGFDAHAGLRRCIESIACKNGSVDAELKRIQGYKRQHDRDRTREGLLDFVAWKERHRLEFSEGPQSVLFESQGGSIVVQARSGLAYHHLGQRYLACLWNTKEPPMTSEMAALLLMLMRRLFITDEYSEEIMAVRDLVAGKVLTEINLGVHAWPDLDEHMKELENLWIGIVGRSKGQSGEVHPQEIPAGTTE